MNKRFATATATLLLFIMLLPLCSCDNNYIEKTSKNLNNYSITLGYDEESHILSAVQKVTFTNNTENALDCVKFHIYANIYRDDSQTSVVPKHYMLLAYINGESYGDITIDCVKLNGKSVPFVIEGTNLDILSVPSESDIYPSETVDIEMVYKVQLANISHRLGYTNNVVNLGNFYPVLCVCENNTFDTSPYYNIGDPFVTDVANYNVTIAVPCNYIVASTGELTSAQNGEDSCIYTYTAKAVRDFAMVLSPNFTKETSTYDDIAVNYYHFDDKECETSLANAISTIKLLNEKVGKYPYNHYELCETLFCYGGMEYSCLSMVTSLTTSYQEAVIHETVHQWFYGIVGNNQITDAWMDEGLTEFITMLVLDKLQITPLETSLSCAMKTFTTYVDVLNNYYSSADTSLRAIGDYKNDSEYVCMTYVKGSLLFNTIYETLGENKFWSALKTYFDTCKLTIATPEELIECFNKAGKKNVSPIFEAYISGKDILSEFNG